MFKDVPGLPMLYIAIYRERVKVCSRYLWQSIWILTLTSYNVKNVLSIAKVWRQTQSQNPCKPVRDKLQHWRNSKGHSCSNNSCHGAFDRLLFFISRGRLLSVITFQQGDPHFPGKFKVTQCCLL